MPRNRCVRVETRLTVLTVLKERGQTIYHCLEDSSVMQGDCDYCLVG
jgi:hypothetical protein